MKLSERFTANISHLCWLTGMMIISLFRKQWMEARIFLFFMHAHLRGDAKLIGNRPVEDRHRTQVIVATAIGSIVIAIIFKMLLWVLSHSLHIILS